METQGKFIEDVVSQSDTKEVKKTPPDAFKDKAATNKISTGKDTDTKSEQLHEKTGKTEEIIDNLKHSSSADSENEARRSAKTKTTTLDVESEIDSDQCQRKRSDSSISNNGSPSLNVECPTMNQNKTQQEMQNEERPVTQCETFIPDLYDMCNESYSFWNLSGQNEPAQSNDNSNNLWPRSFSVTDPDLSSPPRMSWYDCQESSSPHRGGIRTPNYPDPVSPYYQRQKMSSDVSACNTVQSTYSWVHQQDTVFNNSGPGLDDTYILPTAAPVPAQNNMDIGLPGLSDPASFNPSYMYTANQNTQISIPNVRTNIMDSTDYGKNDNCNSNRFLPYSSVENPFYETPRPVMRQPFQLVIQNADFIHEKDCKIIGSVRSVVPLVTGSRLPQPSNSASYCIYKQPTAVVAPPRNVQSEMFSPYFQYSWKSASTVQTSCSIGYPRSRTVRELLEERQQTGASSSLLLPTCAEPVANHHLLKNVPGGQQPIPRLHQPFPVKPPETVVFGPSKVLENLPRLSDSFSKTMVVCLPRTQGSLPKVAESVQVKPSEKTSFLRNVLEKGPTDVPSKDAVVQPVRHDTMGSARRFTEGRVAAQEHRPRHYEMLSLEIGPFSVTVDPLSTQRNLHKFKVVFTRRQFLYEFVRQDTDSETVMGCIIVPFGTLSALRCDDDTVHIRVKTQPVTFVGRRDELHTGCNVYDTSKMVDITNGATAAYPGHTIRLHPQEAVKLKMYLWHFSSVFHDLMLAPMDKGPLKTALPLPVLDCNSWGVRVDRKRKSPAVIHESRKGYPILITPVELPSIPSVCSCRISCRSARCSCVKARTKCNTTRAFCMCSNCDNPLNLLEASGISLTDALQDTCLMQNIYKITDLLHHLCLPVKTSCCSCTTVVRDCIPGRVKCPNPGCSRYIQYSWCSHAAEADDSGTNHCSVCVRCNLSQGQHCKECNTCYFYTETNKSCPSCQTADASR